MEKTYDPKKVEERTYKWWKENGWFKPEVNPDGKPYTIMMPPPNVTGQLHMGHAFDDTLQDTLIRYHRMLGEAALWMPGMDHASIATEVKVLDKIKNETGKTKQELTREEFLEEAWDWADTYRNRIREQIEKLGASCDWDRERFTMDEGCSNSVKRAFEDLYKKGLIYKGSRIINWCPDCRTALSDAEVEYEEQAGHMWHIRYPIKGEEGRYVTVATTRPETMLGDTGVAVNPNDERYQDLVGKTVILPLVGREIPVVADDYVDMTFGTGVVKMTPAHDPNDYEVGKRHNLEEINIMNEDGSLNHLAGEKYEGLDRYEARDVIVKELDELGYLDHIEDHVHNVGTCYRCGTTVETMTSEQWFVAMQELAKPALEAVKEGKTRFIPDRFTKTYNNWLENIRDWCISRQLWWGHQIPAYTCKSCGEVIVGDQPKSCPTCGSTTLIQEEDVLDTWFSSGLWPFSTLGWPAETEDLKKFYPNSALVTGYDIIFFWVARMIFMGLFEMGEVPFEDVYIHGLIRDSQGRKMSKSLGNGVDPLEVIDEFSADALRFSIITGNAAGNDIRWQEEKLTASRNFLNKLWNAARFTLMNLEETIPEIDDASLEESDKWILSRMNRVVSEVRENMDKYELGLAAQKAYDFTWNEFCDWYIELVKPRLYGEDERSKNAAQHTLNLVLTNILKMLHPVIPFITEEIYGYLPEHGEALIIESFPQTDEALDFPQEERDVNYLMDVIRAIRNIRKNLNVPNSKKASLYYKTDDREKEAILKRSHPMLMKLASVSEEMPAALPDEADLKKYTSAVAGGTEIFLALDDLVDKEKEIQRLSAEKEKLEKELVKVSKKLENPGFVQKAPEAVVNKEREKKAAFEENLKKITDRLKDL